MKSSLIRNFCIVAHVDHGKSTLADRLLELTDTISKGKLAEHEQYLDQNPIERERGITIKLAPVRMHYREYILNLIDTPGHVDFSYEVSRSLAAVEGAILLVDATTGIQAQTINNLNQALAQNLTIIPVINKIDLDSADVAKTIQDMIDTFGFAKEDILLISAKTGENVPLVLDAIIKRIPPPKGKEDAPLKALIFDNQYDQFKGVLAFVRIIDGIVEKGTPITFLGSKTTAQSIEVGLFLPTLVVCEKLTAGEIGYVATGLKDSSQAQVGDTMTTIDNPTPSPIPGYKLVKPMVFAALFPTDNKDFRNLAEGLAKLKLNDSSLFYEPEHSDALGAGFRVGFLGLLHLEVVQERLEREYNLSLIASIPTVKYMVENTRGEIISVERPEKLPESSIIKEIKEPIVNGRIIVPKQYIGGIVTLLADKRGEMTNMEYRGEQVFIDITIPLAEIVIDFYNRLKNISSGFASFDYELTGFKSVDVVRLDILVAKERVDALSQIVVREQALFLGRRLVEKLKEVIPKQQFEISIQAAIGATIIARADIAAFRKDMLQKMSGGDRTRKDKLLEAQKKGKKRMKMVGNVEIPQEAFLSVLRF